MAIKLQIFTIKKNPKVDSNHTCLAAISLDSALKRDGSYYPQVFLKECKYIEKKVIRHMIISVILHLQMSLMTNKLELFRFVFQKIEDITSQMENAHMCVAFLKLCLQCIKIH